MQNNTDSSTSSIRSKTIMAFLIVIIMGGIFVNLSFQYILQKGMTNEQIQGEAFRRISSTVISMSSGITIIGCVVVIIISILFSKRITDPILTLTRAVNEMAKGRLSTRVDLESDDELGELGHAFNKMADELENALRRSEEQRNHIAGVVEAVPSILIILNDKLEILLTNIIHYKFPIPIKPDEVVDLLKEEVSRCFMTGKCQRKEITVNLNGDSIVFLSQISIIEKTKEGYTALISLTDITEIRKAKEELEKRVEELERFRKATIKREFRMRELKTEVGRLREEVRRLRG